MLRELAGIRLGSPGILLDYYLLLVVVYVVVFQVHVVDVVEIPPFEELPHRKCSPRRGELDSSTPRVLRVF